MTRRRFLGLVMPSSSERLRDFWPEATKLRMTASSSSSSSLLSAMVRRRAAGFTGGGPSSSELSAIVRRRGLASFTPSSPRRFLDVEGRGFLGGFLGGRTSSDESEDEGPAVGVLNAVVEEDESDDEAPVRVVPPQSPPRVLESPRTPHRLADAPSPSGRLEQRLQILKERCIGQMGARQFRRAYDYLKSVQDADDDALDHDVDDATNVGRSFDASANERPRQKGSFEEEGKAIEPILASAASLSLSLSDVNIEGGRSWAASA